MELRDPFAQLQEGLVNPISHASLTVSPASIAAGMFRSVPAAPTDSSSGRVKEERERRVLRAPAFPRPGFAFGRDPTLQDGC